MDILSRYDRDSRLFAFAFALSLGCHLLFVFFFPGVEASASIPAVERPECTVTVIVPEEEEAFAFTPQAVEGEAPAPSPLAAVPAAIEEPPPLFDPSEAPAASPVQAEAAAGRQEEPAPPATAAGAPESARPEPLAAAPTAPTVHGATVAAGDRAEPIGDAPVLGLEPSVAAGVPTAAAGSRLLPQDEHPSSAGSGHAAASGLGDGVTAAVTAPGAALAGLLPVRPVPTEPDYLAYRDRVGKLLRDDVERRFRRLAAREDEGTVRFRITVDANGRAALGELAGASPLLERLVREALAAVRLPAPPSTADAVQLAYRFRFELR